MSPGAIILAGGGTPEQERPLMQWFLDQLAGEKVLYVPLALDPDGPLYAGASVWIRDTLKGLETGHRRLDILTCDAGSPLAWLNDCSGLFIGGGNTFRLAHLLGMGKATRNSIGLFLSSGGLLYGGSAGALICGKYLNLSDSEDNFNAGHDGLDLLHGYSMCCHYQPEDNDRIAGFIQERNSGVIALPETGGVLIQGERLKVLGTGDVMLFYADGHARSLQTGGTARL